MNYEELKYAVNSLMMPEGMADNLERELEKTQSQNKKIRRFFRYSSAAAAAIALATLLIVGTTSYAAYHVYQVKNLRVFFEPDVTDEQIKGAEEVIKSLRGVSSVEFIAADDAWKEFKEEYFLDEDVEQEFTENPLKDSYNYKVGVELSGDTKAIRTSIENIEGVRLVCDLTEL